MVVIGIRGGRSNTYPCTTPKELGGFSAPVKRLQLEGRTQVGQRGSLRAVEDWVIAGTFSTASLFVCVLRFKLKGNVVKTLHKSHEYCLHVAMFISYWDNAVRD